MPQNLVTPEDFVLLPQPRKIVRGRGVFHLPARGAIVLDAAAGASERLAATDLGRLLPAAWRIGRRVPRGTSPAITLARSNTIAHAQGYRLVIATGGVRLEARTVAGMFYGLQTLRQIARQYGRAWPVATIDDWPDFDRRGVYHDVSRGKVPRLKTILQLVDDLAALKINEFQLYVENVYAFKKHPEMYADTTPLRARELQTIDRACRRRCIDFVPSLTSLGHFDKILRRPAFRHLAEVEPEALRRAGIKTWSDDPWTLCVTDPDARRLLKDMYAEFLPNFSSQIFNICCDESWDLGQGRSQALAKRIGVGRMYVDWIQFCHQLAARQGRRIQLWGDIILRHPKLLARLPRDATLLEWGYEADHPFAEHGALFARSGRPFYVAPGTSTWLTFAGRTANAFGAMRSAAQSGVRHGAVGFMNTDWGDHGHQQLLAISLLPFAYGAAVCWNQERVAEATVIAATDRHVFHAHGRPFAKLLADLGQTYQRLGVLRRNGSVDWFLFREPWATTEWRDQVQPRHLRTTRAAAQKILAALTKARLQRPDGELICREALLTARTIIYTMDRTLLRQQLARGRAQGTGATLARLSREAGALDRELAALWLLRNKPSRLADVRVHFAQHQQEFRQAAGPVHLAGGRS